MSRKVSLKLSTYSSQRLFGTSICFSHNESHDLRDSHVCVTQPVLHPHLSSGLKRVPITTKKPKKPNLERYRQRATATGTPPPVADHKATKICNDLEVLSRRIFEGLGLSQIQGNQTTFLLLSSNPLPLPLFFLILQTTFPRSPRKPLPSSHSQPAPLTLGFTHRAFA